MQVWGRWERNGRELGTIVGEKKNTMCMYHCMYCACSVATRPSTRPAAALSDQPEPRIHWHIKLVHYGGLVLSLVWWVLVIARTCNNNDAYRVFLICWRKVFFCGAEKNWFRLGWVKRRDFFGEAHARTQASTACSIGSGTDVVLLISSLHHH